MSWEGPADFPLAGEIPARSPARRQCPNLAHIHHPSSHMRLEALSDTFFVPGRNILKQNMQDVMSFLNYMHHVELSKNVM